MASANRARLGCLKLAALVGTATLRPGSTVRTDASNLLVEVCLQLSRQLVEAPPLLGEQPGGFLDGYDIAHRGLVCVVPGLLLGLGGPFDGLHEFLVRWLPGDPSVIFPAESSNG